jgi:hypothetical protein
VASEHPYAVQKDGRKNENWLVKLSKQMDLTNFEFHFFGSGWDEIGNSIRNAHGTVVQYRESGDFSRDYRIIIESLPNLDFWLYFGFDEGSMGSLDAYLAGLPLICTPQGFHLNLVDGIAFPVTCSGDLIEAFKTVDKDYLLEKSFDHFWTWKRYAENCLEIWQRNPSFVSRRNKRDELPDLLDFGSGFIFFAKSFHPSRLVGAIGRSKIGLKVRRIIKR